MCPYPLLLQNEYGGMILMITIILGIYLVAVLLILAAIGFIVYKDAKALGLNAILWTFIALFVPNFIGVIIYIVIRCTTPKNVLCSNCHTKVNENYNICPECGSYFTALCKKCKYPVPPALKICPYCGESTEHLDAPTATKLPMQTNIIKSLGITLAVFFISTIIVIISTLGINFFAQRAEIGPSLSIMNIETNRTNHYKARFLYKNVHTTATFESITDSATSITGKIQLDKGRIHLEVKDPGDTVIFSQTYTAKSAPYLIDIPIEKFYVSYKASITYENAKGMVVLNSTIQPQ